jgi:hypothetical protein
LRSESLLVSRRVAQSVGLKPGWTRVSSWLRSVRRPGDVAVAQPDVLAVYGVRSRCVEDADKGAQSVLVAGGGLLRVGLVAVI